MIIQLTKGKFAIVDERDFEYLNQFKWHAVSSKNSDETWYARRKINGSGGKHIMMHKEILLDASEIDHINRNGLDNRRSNLRPLSHSDNMRNKQKLQNTKSKYRGVHPTNGGRSGSWMARITINKKTIHLGSFKNEEQAAEAYKNAAIKYGVAEYYPDILNSLKTK